MSPSGRGWTSVAIAALLAGCSSSSTSSPAVDAAPSTSDATPDAASTCALREGVCSGGAGLCCPQTGAEYDEARRCVRIERNVTIACTVQNPIYGTCASLGTLGCAITNEGGVRKVWFLSSLDPGFAGGFCPDDLRQEVTNAPACGDGG